MRIAPEGWPFVLIGAAITAILALFVLYQGSNLAAVPRVSLVAVSIFMAVLTLFTLYFFRNPSPAVPSDPAAVLAPAEGKVIEIVQMDEPSFLGGPSTRISIFLSVFNIHVQRAPVSGVVGHRLYHPGKYLAAWNPKASEENERASLGIQAGEHRILVGQIAGLIARRIVTDPMEGDTVTKGERFGLIRFGSRVDLFIPPDWVVVSTVGDKVKVGETVVARIPGAGTGNGG